VDANVGTKTAPQHSAAKNTDFDRVFKVKGGKIEFVGAAVMSPGYGRSASAPRRNSFYGVFIPVVYSES